MKAWAESLGGIDFPLLSDFWPHGKIAEQYGVLRPDGITERAIFILDPDGILRYIDIHDIDDQPSNAVLLDELAKIVPDGQARATLLRKEEEEEELPHGGVIIYCTQWCPDCKKTRAWLKSNHIPYREVDIEHNARAARQVREWTGGNQTTPTIDIDGTIVFDFDEDRLTELLLKNR